MTEKKCTNCKETKLISDFYLRLGKSGYYPQSFCKDCTKKGIKIWRKKNPEKANIYLKRYFNKYPSKRMIHNIRCGIKDCIKRGSKTSKTFELLGYTIEELKAHLESLFQEGMSWANYGEWHIDHKIPISAFNFDKPEQIDFKRCWALENLQPMWAKENLRKSAKILSAFQPSLKLDSA